MIGKMLDQRAEGIKNELDEARALRDEAQAILASYERKQKEVQEQADRIVEAARKDAEAAAAQAKEDLAKSVARVLLLQRIRSPQHSLLPNAMSVTRPCQLRSTQHVT